MGKTLFGQTIGIDYDFEVYKQYPIIKEANTDFGYRREVGNQPKKLRVASYCRVSTDEELQLNSLENQIIHYTNYIRSNPEWQFAGIFSDRGKSGTKTQSRTGFNKMIRYARSGKIDIIICKSISRFARNVLDTLNTVKLLKEDGVRVIFERENIDTGSMSSDFILTLLSATAEEESRSISDNINWSLTKRFESGEPIFARLMGYAKVDNKPWVIVEEEAKIVREAFEEYLKGNTPTQIAKMFIRKGYKKANGRRDWSAIAVRDILKNERYTGDALCQKTYTKDHLSHSVAINNGERNQYLLKNHHDPIVDRGTFEKVQKLLSKNSRKVIRDKRKTYPLSGRLVCAECGSNFQRFICRGKVTWRCGKHTKSKLLCSMTGIREENIRQALTKAFIKKYQAYDKEHEIQITKLIKELQRAESRRENEQNQLRVELEKALLAENAAIIKLKDTTELTQKRIEIEEKIAKKELLWELFDEDGIYRKESMEELERLKSMSVTKTEFEELINDIKFIRAWVILIKAVSPYLFSITWINGEETEIMIEKGDDQ